LSGVGKCGLCARDPAAGFASVGDVWYCHGDEDPEPTCYMRAQSGLVLDITPTLKRFMDALPYGEGRGPW
jgi:hypothetical protein